MKDYRNSTSNTSYITNRKIQRFTSVKVLSAFEYLSFELCDKLF